MNGVKLQLDTATTYRDPRQSRTSASTSTIPNTRQKSDTAGLQSSQTSRNPRTLSSPGSDSVRAPTDANKWLETNTSGKPRGSATNTGSLKGAVRSPGPPTSSYLYSDSEQPPARTGGATPGPVTLGRPFPAVPGASKKKK